MATVVVDDAVRHEDKERYNDATTRDRHVQDRRGYLLRSWVGVHSSTASDIAVSTTILIQGVQIGLTLLPTNKVPLPQPFETDTRNKAQFLG